MGRVRTTKHPLASKKNVFHYSAYWGTWSRVLTSYVDGNGTLEVNLTPVNPYDQKSWEEFVRPVIFRNHGTSLEMKDKLELSLPNDILEWMLERLDDEILVHRLIATDWMESLDLPIVRLGRYGGGGLPFKECMKGIHLPNCSRRLRTNAYCECIKVKS
jgi:hypothetical protein